LTSTTSAFGAALRPADGGPAAWVTEDIVPLPKNIYGVTKLAAESLCERCHRRHALPTIVLRTSRFFPEPDDDPAVRAAFSTPNAQANELLHRRVDLEDVVPETRALYARRGWRPAASIDRVYVNDRARAALAWTPRHDFARVLECLRRGADHRSALAREVGAKGYHDAAYRDGLYPTG
jgi:UDP-glucose 4-epimerase